MFVNGLSKKIEEYQKSEKIYIKLVFADIDITHTLTKSSRFISYGPSCLIMENEVQEDLLVLTLE
jgi:hypothetical protein